MRVITGSARGRKLKTLEGMDTRPTSDRVKEAVFSAIQFELPGSVFLDLFAGSGQMGIEALSRGAKQAVFNDLNPKAVQVVKDNLLSTGFSRQARVLNLSLEGFLRTDKTQFDLAYLDPPYRSDLLLTALEGVTLRMKEGGKILCEHPWGQRCRGRWGIFPCCGSTATVKFRSACTEGQRKNKEKGRIHHEIGSVSRQLRPHHQRPSGHYPASLPDVR